MSRFFFIDLKELVEIDVNELDIYLRDFEDPLFPEDQQLPDVLPLPAARPAEASPSFPEEQPFPPVWPDQKAQQVPEALPVHAAQQFPEDLPLHPVWSDQAAQHFPADRPAEAAHPFSEEQPLSAALPVQAAQLFPEDLQLPPRLAESRSSTNSRSSAVSSRFASSTASRRMSA